MCLFCNDIFIDLYRTHVKIEVKTTNKKQTLTDMYYCIL